MPGQQLSGGQVVLRLAVVVGVGLVAASVVGVVVFFVTVAWVSDREPADAVDTMSVPLALLTSFASSGVAGALASGVATVSLFKGGARWILLGVFTIAPLFMVGMATLGVVVSATN